MPIFIYEIDPWLGNTALKHELFFTMNFQASKVAFARCHLLMGSWQEALDAAQVVLNEDKRNIKSIYVKAEALFNLCEFEHSLVLFHRGLVSISLAKKINLIHKKIAMLI